MITKIDGRIVYKSEGKSYTLVLNKDGELCIGTLIASTPTAKPEISWWKAFLGMKEVL